jgi:hypothetical protein
MNNLQDHNLDYLAARQAQSLVTALQENAKDAENTITKTLGVLQENGVYACFLYLLAREKKGEVIAAEMLALLAALEFPTLPQNSPDRDAVLNYIADEKVSGDLHRLLLAKAALEQMLIYARYGAKARQKEKE